MAHSEPFVSGGIVKRPWSVQVSGGPIRTFATEERALGAALVEVSHRAIGTEAWVHERWLNGSTHVAYVLKRMPSHSVHTRLEWIADADGQNRRASEWSQARQLTHSEASES